MATPAEPAPRVVRRPGMGRVLLVSVSVLSVVFLAVLVGWPSALSLMGVLLHHEVGHAAAMLAVGERAHGVRIVLLPWTAVTFGRSSLQLDPQAWILLGGAGLSALVGTAALVLAGLAGGAFAATAGALVLLLAVVNLLTLLPFAPLDGGRLVLRLADGRGAGAGLLARLVLLVLALGLVLATGGHFLGWVFLGFATLGLGLFAATRTFLRRTGPGGGGPQREATGFWLFAYATLVVALVGLASGAWSLAGAPAVFARLFPM